MVLYNTIVKDMFDIELSNSALYDETAGSSLLPRTFPKRAILARRAAGFGMENLGEVRLAAEAYV
jgi:hypothetical protein